MSRALKTLFTATALSALAAFVVAHAPGAHAQDQDQAPASATPATAATPAAGAATPPAGAADDLPPGPDHDLVQTTCTQCHPSTQFSGLHKDAQGWSDIVNEMTAMGATIPDENVPKIVAYLATSFGPAADSSTTAPGATAPATPTPAAPAAPAPEGAAPPADAPPAQ